MCRYLLIMFAIFSVAGLSTGCSSGTADPDEKGDYTSGSETSFDLSKLTPEARLTYKVCEIAEGSDCLRSPSSKSKMHDRCKQYATYNFTDKCSESDREAYTACFQKWLDQKMCWHNFTTPFADCAHYGQVSFDCVYTMSTLPDEYPDPQYNLKGVTAQTKEEAVSDWCDHVVSCELNIFEGNKSECVEKSLETYDMLWLEEGGDELLKTNGKYGTCTGEDIAKALQCQRKYQTTCLFDHKKLATDPTNPEIMQEFQEVTTLRREEERQMQQCLQNEVSKDCLYKLGRTKGY